MAADETVRSVDHTTSTRNWNAIQETIHRAIAAQWLDLDKHIAFHGAYVLDQVVCRRQDDCWQMILKAHRNGRPYASYVSAPSMWEAFELTGEFADRGVLTWQADDYPSKRLKRLLGWKRS